MRQACLCLLVLLLLPLAAGAQQPMAKKMPAKKKRLIHAAPHPAPSLAYRWVEIVLEASARSVDRIGARPPQISREMVIPITAMYDAWAAYDAKAAGRHTGGDLRRPVAERTLRNKEIAISYAALRGLLYVYPEDCAWIKAQMRALGFDPDDLRAEPTSSIGVGNRAARAVIEFHRHDGANQHGDEVGSNGQPYSDYTFYEPRNPHDRIIDPDRWQEIPFVDRRGRTFFLSFLTPHWYRVKTSMLARSDQFRPGPPPKVGSKQLAREVAECVELNGNLTLEQKAIVEFMRDGPRSTGQSGHWLRFATDVSRRERYGLDMDVKLFFAIAVTAFDTFIGNWEAKRYYDSSRPWTLVRWYYKGKKIRGYLGPCKGFAMIPAERWHPYSPADFVTPPFPGYPSGHSTVSGGCSKMLELFTGSDHFGAVALRTAGALTEPGCGVGQMQAFEGKTPGGLPEKRRVALELPTFTATAELAGISRVLGGYHIQSDNLAALDHGRRMARYIWSRLQQYYDGTILQTMSRD